MADAGSLAQGAAELLMDDESLRGDLTDIGYGPVLNWATDALTAAAERYVALPDTEAQAKMDAASGQVKQLLKAVVQTAEQHTRADVLALFKDPLLARNFRARARVIVCGVRLGADIDDNAVRLVHALRDVHP
jgi:hypothetical protein